jgi:hypothetical protein
MRILHGVGLCLLALPAQGELQGRQPTVPNGADFRAYYDTVLDVTWIANANYSQTLGYDLDGLLPWDQGQEWIQSLNARSYLGVDDWRMPETDPLNGVDYEFGGTVAFDGSNDIAYNVSAPGTLFAGSTASEMAHLFHNTLGNLSRCDPASASSCTTQPGSGLAETGPFANLLPDRYWSGSEGTDTTGAFFFDFDTGLQGRTPKGNAMRVWTVRTGDIPLPEPASTAWSGAAALGLVAWARRRRR